MTDPKDPLKDGLTPPDYDEYGDAPDSGENDPEEKDAPKLGSNVLVSSRVFFKSR